MGRRTAGGVPLLVAALVLLGACSGGSVGDGRPEGEGRSGGGARSSAGGAGLSLVGYRGAGSLALDGCAGLGAPPVEQGRRVLVGFRVRAAAEVRLHRLVVSASTNGFDYLERFVARDVDPAAPQVVAYDSATPSRDRLADGTRPVGDPRDTAAGLSAVQDAWQRRERVSSVRLGPGEHYVFVRAELGTASPELAGLSVVWSRDGQAQRLLTVGDLLLRAPRCGG